MEKRTAVVKWFNDKQGFGFVVNSDGEDVFVHHKSIIMEGYRRLDENQKVEYKPVTTNEGLAAAEVVVIETAE